MEVCDIGLQALSGAIDRGDKIIYIAMIMKPIMNTGVSAKQPDTIWCKNNNNSSR
jgi:pyruvate/2-oxoacid:ferredoxin oxidoreductase beta subunit